jgi:hypothetical protein
MQLNANLSQVANQMKAAQMTPQMRRTLSSDNKRLMEQQKRLLAQQSQQQMIPQTQQQDGMFQGYPENMNDLLNNSVAPNVSLAVKPRPGGGPQTPNSADVSQLSPRYPIPIGAGVPSPLPQSPAPQLSPGPAAGRQPYSPAPAGQQSYPSPSGATAGYPTANQHRMSPHFVSSPSPATGGPNSPLMQMSPQTNSWPPQHQAVRPPPQMAQPSQVMGQQPGQNVSLQQTNPMLNAQLSGTSRTHPCPSCPHET